MSDGSIALVAGLLSGGFGILGVVVGYLLQKRGSKKQAISDAVYHVYEQLAIIVDNRVFWHIEGPPTDDDIDAVSEVMNDVIDTVAKTRGFPCLYEVLLAVAAVSDLNDLETWEDNYSSDYRFGLYHATKLLEKKIDNREFTKAFSKAHSEARYRRLRKDGVSEEYIDEIKQTLKRGEMLMKKEKKAR